MLEPRPNILFFIADDHRFDAFGAGGDPIVQTPVLDSLAAQGVQFQRTYMMGGMTCAVCVPARAALHTGVSSFRASATNEIEAMDGLMTLRPSLMTLGQILRHAGYQTHGIGKWHSDPASFTRSFQSGSRIFMGGMNDQWHMPLHDYDPTGRYPRNEARSHHRHSSELFCEAAVNYLDEYAESGKDNPFFLYVSFTSPHDPRTAPEPFASRYSPEKIPLPPSFLPEHPFDNGELQVRDELLAAFPRSPAEIQRHTADYYAMISHMDAQIGGVLDTLERRGLAENTIVVYLADHGLAVGRHGLMGKQNMYEHSVRVPFLMRGPGVPRGVTSGALAYSFDVYPTLCELAGVEPPEGLDAKSLCPAFAGEPAPHRSHIGAAYKDMQRMWTDGEWKLIRYFQSEDGQHGENRVQLFHLPTDPHETHDLAANDAHRERVHQLTRELARWQIETGDVCCHLLSTQMVP